MRKRLVACGRITLYAVLLVLTACGDSKAPTPQMPEVPVVEVLQRDVPLYIELVGQTQGSKDIPIRARVDGVLESMDFHEGRLVKKGQLLYTIDPQPFDAKLAAAESRVAEAMTMLAKSKSDLDRIAPLAEMRAVSEQDLDAAVAQHEAAQASLEAARAERELAKIELGYTRIRAPIDGRIGISAAKVGEYVGKPPNPVVLNIVSQSDPIRVRFAISERDYLRYARQMAAARDRAEHADPDEEGAWPLELILADGSTHAHTGRITSADAIVDAATGTLTMEADFPNPEGLVLAGQFARVRGVGEKVENGLLVPQRSVMEMQGQFTVAVVGADGSVEIRKVQPGARVGRMQLIESGLKAGERVAVEGLQRLRQGMKVEARLVELEDSPGVSAEAAAKG